MKLDVQRIFVTASLVFLFDQITKIVLRSTFQVGENIPILPFFSIDRVENTGAAFGMMMGQNTFFIMTSFIVLGVLVVARKSLPQDAWLSWLGQGFIWGGAFGNLMDRFLFGKVTDFLDFFVADHHWPSFNVADSAITVGTGLLLWCSCREKR